MASRSSGKSLIARAEVRRGRRIPMDQPRPGAAGGELTVSEQTSRLAW